MDQNIYAPFDSYANAPLVPTALAIATPLGFLHTIVAKVLTDLFPLEKPDDGFSSPIMELVGSDAVLNVIGKISGLNDENNPSYEYENRLPLQALKPKYLGDADLAFSAHGDLFSRNAQGTLDYWSSGSQTIHYRLYGEHDNLARVEEFWRVFSYRLWYGDSIAHAIYVTKQFLNIWRSAANLDRQIQFAEVGPNQYSSTGYQPTGAFYTDDVKFLEKKIFDALVYEVDREVKEEYPDVYQAELIKTGRAPIQAPTAFQMKAKGALTSPLALVGLALGAIGIARISARKH